ncbi:MAG: 5-(carboxyamino)imidazole ribonucleotide mutase [bacterium]|nr:5-(carboxyamino)imidazole ribonucleotide mutase [bacterium]
MSDKPVVGFLVGSKSDLKFVQEGLRLLEEFGIPYDLQVISAHRTPDQAAQYARDAESAGLKVIIAAAGAAAHLAGAIASHTTLPVIGVPIPSSDLKGLDSLLSTVQMPAGIPVATMAIGEAGATNAAILAAEILALSDPNLAEKLHRFRKELAKRTVSGSPASPQREK